MLLSIAVVSVALPLVGSPTRASAATLAFSTVQLPDYGGEPSITSDNNGLLYVSTPSGVPNPKVTNATEPGTYRSFDKGASWGQIESPDPSSGDTCLATDQANALYWCNLAGSQGSLPLQADVWKSNIAANAACTTTAGTPPGTPNSCNWVHGNPAALGTTNPTPTPCTVPGQASYPTSCNFFGVDRQWTAASNIVAPHPIPAGYTGPQVVLMYHDFYGPSQIWVNISNDGGQTFGAPIEVLANSATVTGAVVAEGFTLCNTVPAGVQIVKPNLPHAGRIYVSWISVDVASNANGCNISMDQSFHTAWVAYSDDNGTTWTPQMVYDSGVGHDMSTPFASFTLDDRGNPYMAFNTPSPAENPAVCGAESNLGTVQSDASCMFNTYVVWCQCGGNTVSFDDGAGLIGGAAATAYQVNATPASCPTDNTRPVECGTNIYATVAAGDPGQVDVSYLHTDEIVPTGALGVGKFDPLGCDKNDEPAPPPTYPARCHWNLYGAKSLTLTSPPATASWTNVQITSAPMHYGDICNLGIACAQAVGPIPRDPRHLLDFNQETIDPTTGCAHISYADDNAGSPYGDPTNPSPHGGHLVVANEIPDPTTGICMTLTTDVTGIPEAPWAALFVPAAVVGALSWVRGRRRRTAALALN
ncbi:MAG: hypothetical protein DLM65_00350 [Candidatus Aeolococcus gillhamiae]|uniref:Exo-alpha-sialidase n=1 Tax=Candidatus Aeolococcus gillhamiae TaxID=3127015 RepID=A0A2W5ZFG3_9BACT|nr:MAG: hypothetical protein DLM65_00350 [Candidatus Dormibacter sp. RRmetagenome_bin12]